MNTIEMIKPATPAIIKITPMASRFTCAGFQVMPNRSIAPMTMSAMLPPIVTRLATFPRRTAGPPDRRPAAHMGPGPSRLECVPVLSPQQAQLPPGVHRPPPSARVNPARRALIALRPRHRLADGYRSPPAGGDRGCPDL